MAQEYADIVNAFAAYERSIREGRYYDAHEDLEVIWHPSRFEDRDEVRLWKGFINAAVSFELIRRGRSEPSRRAWNTYQKYAVLSEGFVTPRKELYVTMSKIIETHYANLQRGGNHVGVYGGDGVSPCVQTV